MWYPGILKKGIERFESKSHGADASIEADLAEQMSAFRTNEDEIKRIILSEGLDLDPGTWDESDRESLAREIRKRTKPMVIAANKTDDPAAAANFADIAADPDYDHLPIVPASAHAEKAPKAADEAGRVDYTPGHDDFELVGDVSAEQEAGLERIGSLLDDHGGTGVQSSLEAALFDALDLIAVFPGDRRARRGRSATVSFCPTARRPRTSRTTSTRIWVMRCSTASTAGRHDRSAGDTFSTTAT